MQPTTKPLLSKSRFLAGEQCHLRLWYQCYNPELASEISPAQQAVFDTGHEVGRLATRLFPKGVLVEEDYRHHNEAVQSTLKAIENPNVKSIYEAAFLYDDVRIRVDILEKASKDRWNLHEVKSSTSLKDIYLPDVAVQYYVLKGLGIGINASYLVNINNEYVYDGRNFDLKNFFSSSDLSDTAVFLQNEVRSHLAEFKSMLAAPAPPQIQPSRHCKNPYPCEFWDHCTRVMPKFWIMTLPGITQKKFNELEVLRINEIPETFNLTLLQERVKKCVVENIEYIAGNLETELNDIVYPAHFLDFETINPAIPRFAGTRPYEIIPFQWSDHVLDTDGKLMHREFLHDDKSDPRNDFITTLLEVLETKGTIFIYTPYERTILRKLADAFPEISDEIEAIIDRFKDLCAIIKKYYYHPEFLGSFSLKAVLPVLIPDMNYADLAIQEGGHASVEYLRKIDPATPADVKQKIRRDLLTYCGQDTLALVKIRDELLKKF